MNQKGPGQKGTYGEIGLPVSKRYLSPFKRAYMFRGILASVGVILLFFVVQYLQKDARFASRGALSVNHANLSSDCKACHTPFAAAVDDEKCAVCHEKYGDAIGIYTMAAHRLYRSSDLSRLASDTVETGGDNRSCAFCHQEHEGREVQMTRVPDSVCTTCHFGGSFSKDHPQFDFVEAKQEHPGLKFTHARHIQEIINHVKLADPEKACLHCHHPEPSGRYFEPIDFDRHCDVCHLTTTTATPRLAISREGTPGVMTLEAFQKQNASGSLWAFYTNPNEFQISGDFVRKSPVYHEDPWILENLRRLRTMLYGDQGLADLLIASADLPEGNPNVLYEEAMVTLKNRMLALRSDPEQDVQKELQQIERLMTHVKQKLQISPGTGSAFIKKRKHPQESANLPVKVIDETIRLLTKPCLQCHEVREGTIVRVQKDQRVLKRAEYNHRAHIVQRRCLDCHTKIQEGKESEDTAGVQNIPVIEQCQDCHNPKGASTRCGACHLFHANKTQHANMLLYVEGP